MSDEFNKRVERQVSQLSGQVREVIVMVEHQNKNIERQNKNIDEFFLGMKQLNETLTQQILKGTETKMLWHRQEEKEKEQEARIERMEKQLLEIRLARAKESPARDWLQKYWPLLVGVIATGASFAPSIMKYL